MGFGRERLVVSTFWNMLFWEICVLRGLSSEDLSRESRGAWVLLGLVSGDLGPGFWRWSGFRIMLNLGSGDLEFRFERI